MLSLSLCCVTAMLCFLVAFSKNPQTYLPSKSLCVVIRPFLETTDGTEMLSKCSCSLKHIKPLWAGRRVWLILSLWRRNTNSDALVEVILLYSKRCLVFPHLFQHLEVWGSSNFIQKHKNMYVASPNSKSVQSSQFQLWLLMYFCRHNVSRNSIRLYIYHI